MSALVRCVEEQLGELPGAEPWRSAVLACAVELQRALRGDDVHAVDAAVARLAGLGEGSTPAGDDYIVGVLHALRVRPRADALAAHGPRDCVRLAEIAAARTTSLSAEWLREAGRGEASPRWRSLLDALERGDERRVRAAARSVRASGHTSGAFSLRGFLDTVAG